MNKYRLLAEKTEQMERLDKEIQLLRLDLLDEVQAEGGKVQNEFGIFQAIELKNWTYPKYIVEQEDKVNEKIKKLKATVKLAKEKSQILGRATFETVPAFRFIRPKN